MHGIDAEKNKIEDIDICATTNRVTKSLFVTKSEGKNISASPVAAAFETSSGSGV